MIPTADTLQRANEIIRQIEARQSELASLFSGSGKPAAKRRGRPPGPGKASANSNRASGKRRGPRNMSAEARAKIAAAQKARWAKFRAGNKNRGTKA
ncbi:MAG: hypothetical protein AB7J34_25320 [Limisphaerales bacterium]